MELSWQRQFTGSGKSDAKMCISNGISNWVVMLAGWWLSNLIAVHFKWDLKHLHLEKIVVKYNTVVLGRDFKISDHEEATNLTNFFN